MDELDKIIDEYLNATPEEQFQRKVLDAALARGLEREFREFLTTTPEERAQRRKELEAWMETPAGQKMLEDFELARRKKLN